MSLFKPLLSRSSYSLLRPRNIAHKSYSPRSFKKTPSHSVGAEKQSDSTKPRKPLDILFKDAVDIYPKQESGESEGEEENNKVKRGLRELEKEIKNLRANSDHQSDGKEKVGEESTGKKSLFAVFTNKVRSRESPNDMDKKNPRVVKELSPDMKLFLSHLYKKGYLKEANFLPSKNSDDNDLDFCYFDNSYGIDFIKFAAQKYAKDNQEIAKWLSGSDLKNVVLFGCPSLAKKSIFAAKRLRNFFEVQEDTVCKRCVLKQSCKFVNQNVWNADTKKLILTDVLYVITLYTLETVPPELFVPDDVKASASKLLNEVVKLSQTTS
ncbi:hypothetical protein F8388_006835 [Cannabis sativa]|uniref:Uncharacterized protein n=1 Tax=Cannabis sativa TaxID=3483 RepID=A0A7J6GX17_CANSA|nr:hypothetical protein F8388_006835 [Cannabis sativa]KAF4397930.1 hypothetical protein G4B88_019651 [Cannabis sativa]